MRRQREPTQRMIHRAYTMKAPEISREHAVHKLFTLTPPTIPNAAQVIIRARQAPTQVSRQQSTETEQSSLKGQQRIRARHPPRPLFGQALHRPEVVFVTERPEQTFPQCLFPADVLSARPERRRLVLQPDVRRLMQQICQRRRR